MSTKPITEEALLRDIRAHCVDCMGGQRGMVAFCTSEKCRLWPWRNEGLPLRRAAPPPLTGEACEQQLSMLDKEAMA